MCNGDCNQGRDCDCSTVTVKPYSDFKHVESEKWLFKYTSPDGVAYGIKNMNFFMYVLLKLCGLRRVK